MAGLFSSGKVSFANKIFYLLAIAFSFSATQTSKQNAQLKASPTNKISCFLQLH